MKTRSLLAPIANLTATLATALPAQSTRVTLDAAADTYVYETNPDTNHGSASIWPSAAPMAGCGSALSCSSRAPSTAPPVDL